MKKKILIVDDHAVVRKGLMQILHDEIPDAVCNEAESVEELNRKLKQDDWDVIILDISLPHSNGLDAVKNMRAEKINIPVLILTMHPEDQYALRALKAGASGFLNKESAPDELVNAVRKLLEGRKYISDSLAEKLASNLDPNKPGQLHESLSDREFQVMCMLATGKSMTEIAEKLSLGVTTVSTYRTRIMHKLNFKTNADLTFYAIKEGLV